MNTTTTSTVIDLATRIQRRRDFVAHLTGYGIGVIILVATQACGASRTTTAVIGALVWATALSFQHFRHVIFGPVTPADVLSEEYRMLPDPEGRTVA